VRCITGEIVQAESECKLVSIDENSYQYLLTKRWFQGMIAALVVLVSLGGVYLVRAKKSANTIKKKAEERKYK